MLLGMVTVAPLCFTTIRSAAKRQRQQPPPSSNRQHNRNSTTTTTTKNTTKIGFGSKKKEPVWQCAHNCGACCKLDKGPSFPSPEEIFDDPSDLELFNSLVGPDGWCIHYDKATRKCSIYADRPYFCRVEPDVFKTLYGIEIKKFNKEACSSCIDTIKAVYGSGSKELENFNNAIWGTLFAEPNIEVNDFVFHGVVCYEEENCCSTTSPETVQSAILRISSSCSKCSTVEKAQLSAAGSH